MLPDSKRNFIIYFSGQTVSNITRRINGHGPGALTDLGKKQADLLGQKLTNERFDYIYCSDLNRTKQTLEGILAHQPEEERKKVTYTEELREVKMDSIEDQPLEIIEKIRSAGRFRFGKNAGTSDECLVDVFYRCSKFLDSLIQKFVNPKYKSGITQDNYIQLNDTDDVYSNKEIQELFDKGELTNKELLNTKMNKKILLVTHGRFIAELLYNLLYRMGKKVGHNWETSNTALYCFKIYKPDDSKEDSIEISIDVLNNTSHLL